MSERRRVRRVLETFQQKVEKLAELYADLIGTKIMKNENLDEINEGIRMLRYMFLF